MRLKPENFNPSFFVQCASKNKLTENTHLCQGVSSRPSTYTTSHQAFQHEAHYSQTFNMLQENIKCSNCELCNPRDLGPIVSSLTKSEKYILNYLLALDNKYEKIQLSYTTIALKNNCNEKTVRRSVSKLVALKLIKKTNTQGGSNHYQISEEFHNEHNRSFLGEFLPALCYVKMSSYPETNRKCPGYILNNIYISRVPWSEKKSRINWQEFYFNLGKQEIAMDVQYHNQPTGIVPDYISRIKEIKITKKEQVELSMFSEETIGYARKVIMQKIERDGPLDRPFSYFLKICQLSSSKPPMSSKVTKSTKNTAAMLDKRTDDFLKQKQLHQQEVEQSWQRLREDKAALENYRATSSQALSQVGDPLLRNILAGILNEKLQDLPDTANYSMMPNDCNRALHPQSYEEHAVS